MKMLLLGMLAVALSGCMITDDRDYDSRFLARFYSRSEVDAINTQIVCKQAARSLLQVARCEVRR
jgi:hypothetical protein